MVILEHCEGSDCLATRPAGWWHAGLTSVGVGVRSISAPAAVLAPFAARQRTKVRPWSPGSVGRRLRGVFEGTRLRGFPPSGQREPSAATDRGGQRG